MLAFDVAGSPEIVLNTGADQVVATEAVLASASAVSAAEREAGDTGDGDDVAGARPNARLVVEVAPGADLRAGGAAESIWLPFIYEISIITPSSQVAWSATP